MTKTSRKSFEDVEVLKSQLKEHIERCIELHDQLTNYQEQIVNPVLKNPFCLTCGEAVDGIGGIWKCDSCRKWEKTVNLAKYKTATRATDGS
jgi:tRNA(Ile2) C34 agmatinyltransferase TiaS